MVEIPEPSEGSSWSDIWEAPRMTRREYAGIARGLKGMAFPEESLDTLYLWWRSFDSQQSFMVRFASAVSDDPLPEQEKAWARERFNTTREGFEKLISIIRGIKQNQEMDPSQVVAGAETIDEIEKLSTLNGQAIAVCEAIKDSGKTDPREIRQRVAQHAIEELAKAFVYENLYHAADVSVTASIIDSLETEKKELLAQLRGDVWDDEKEEEMRKLYERWRGQVREAFSDSINERLSVVWRAAVGQNLDKISAFDILTAQAGIFRDLSEEGALVFELGEQED